MFHLPYTTQDYWPVDLVAGGGRTDVAVPDLQVRHALWLVEGGDVVLEHGQPDPEPRRDERLGAAAGHLQVSGWGRRARLHTLRQSGSVMLTTSFKVNKNKTFFPFGKEDEVLFSNNLAIHFVGNSSQKHQTTRIPSHKERVNLWFSTRPTVICCQKYP